MRTIKRISPDVRIRKNKKIYELIPGATESFYVSFKELMELEFIRVTLTPHKALSIEKKMRLSLVVLFYKQVGVIVDDKDVFFDTITKK